MYTPLPGSPLIDAGDPDDGAGTDIGVVETGTVGIAARPIIRTAGTMRHLDALYDLRGRLVSRSSLLTKTNTHGVFIAAGHETSKKSIEVMRLFIR
jgi:hypothetical protein